MRDFEPEAIADRENQAEVTSQRHRATSRLSRFRLYDRCLGELVDKGQPAEE